MSSNSDAPNSNPGDRGSGPTDSDKYRGMGDNPVEDRRDRCISGNQKVVNQQQSSGQNKVACSDFTYGPSHRMQDKFELSFGSPRRRNDDDKVKEADQGVDYYGDGGAQSGYTPETGQAKTRDKRTWSGPDFHNLDYSGHFKINLYQESESTKNTQILKLETGEEQFVKFCHLFHSDLQLNAVKGALLSNVKLVVTRHEYPPSVCLQQGAPAPERVSVENVLSNLCFQITALNISSKSWNINQVKETLSSLENYQKGIVIGYEVSGDVISYWLAGECGAMKTTMELLVKNLDPRNSQLSQQPTKKQEKDMKSGSQAGDATVTGVTVSIGKTEEAAKSQCTVSDILCADDGSISSANEIEKGYQVQLDERTRQNTNSPSQVSTREPVDQNIDRNQVQTDHDVYSNPIGDPPGGPSVRAHDIGRTFQSTQDKYRQPGPNLSTRNDGNQPEANYTARFNLNKLQINIISSIPILDDFRRKFKNVRLQQDGTHCLHIVGEKTNVCRVETEIQKQLNEIEKEKVDLSSRVMTAEQMSMLRVSDVMDYIKECISKQQLACYLEQDKDTTTVYATGADMDTVLQVIQSAIFCKDFEKDPTWALFIDSPYVQQELRDLQKKYNGKVVIITQSLVKLVCTSNFSDVVLETVNRMKNDFSRVGTKTVQYTPVGHLTVKLCTEVLQDHLHEIQVKYGVEIVPIQKQKQGWKVKGPKGTLEKACTDVTKLAGTVTSKNLPLETKVSKEFFQTKRGQDVMVGVGKDSGCLVTMVKQEVDVTEGKTSGSDRQGSVTQHSSNLAGRRWRSGDDPHIALYCGDGRNSTSDILVKLKRGDLSTVNFHTRDDMKNVVTLNLPDWKDGENKEKNTIHTHFKEIITAAAERKATSVAVLLDDCKSCGWGEKKAYTLLVKNTVYVLQKDNAEACSCTYIVHDKEMFMSLCGVIDDSFTDVKSLTVTDEIEDIGEEWCIIDKSDIREKKPNIVVRHGELANMKSEAIVNTTGKELTLKIGAVSMSMLTAAGPELQKECDLHYHDGISFGEVAITSGCRLKCKHVFHGALPFYNVKNKDLTIMTLFVMNCLKEADKKKCKTISFPALGTGNLGYPRDLVAHTMYDTVNNYFQERPDSNIESVNFVVYPKDKETVKAFEDEDKKQRQRMSEAKVSVPANPVLEKTGVQLRYGDVDLWVTQGQIEKTTAEGLIIFWDNASLYRSPLMCSYFDKNVNPVGVKDLEKKRTKMTHDGLPIVTGGGLILPFQTVIHCLVKNDDFQLGTLMSVLTEADNCKLSSVAISLGQKEPWTRLKLKILNQFCDALKQFEGRNKTLRCIEIVFDSSEIYKSMESHIRSSYASRLVERRAGVGDISGASGGVQNKSEALEGNSRQGFTSHSSEMSDEANLVVSSRSKDNIEKAIQKLQNEITDLQKQQQGHSISFTRTPPPCRKKTPTETRPTPEERDAQSDSGTILKRTEYEDRRLILTSSSPSILDKGRIEGWLKTTPIPQFKVVCPFLDDNEALIILQSVNDAEKLLKQQGSDHYVVKKFPSQTVQNLKAALKKKIVEIIHSHLKPDEIASEILNASGAEWKTDENRNCFLTGSLPEIQCAYRYIGSLISGGNCQYGDQRSQRDKSGAGQGDKKEDDRQSSIQENEQIRRPEVDGGAAGPLEFTNRRGNQQKPVVHEIQRHGDSVGQHEDNRPTGNTGSQKNPKGCDMGAMKKTFFNESEGMNTHISPEEELKSDKGNIDLVNMNGNQRHGKGRQKAQSIDEHQLGGKGNSTGGDVDYDNMSMYNNGRKGRGTDRQDKHDKHSDEHDKHLNEHDKHSDEHVRPETLTCSLEQHNEIRFFNPRIDNEIETTFNHNQTECSITDKFGHFRDAKGQLSNYARREISNLTSTEEGKFRSYNEKEKENMVSMNIFCEYNPRLKRIKLVGKNYDNVQGAEHMILKGIGRSYHQPDQQSTKSRKKKLKSPPSGSEVLQTKDGVQVFVYEGDLLDLAVEAIVHGTNSNLNNSHGLSAVIAKAAGPDLENACRNIFQERILNVTDCCCTTAGNLHYKYIIHAVTPMWSVYKKKGIEQKTMRKIYQDDLCRTIMNALGEAVNVAARSAALPVIGYGEGPSDVLTAAFSEAVKLSCDKFKKSSLKQIHIVDQNSNILEKIMPEFLKAKELNDTTTLVTTIGGSSQYGAHCVSRLHADLSYYNQWMAKSEIGGTFMLSEKLRVCITKGTYVNTPTSILVSIEDEMFQSNRYVALEIAKVAGNQYKKEIDKLRKKKQKYQISDVVCTGAGKIQHASHVFHVIGPVADKDISGNAELFKGFTDNIRACIFQVLRNVDEMKLDSVALPTFASGTFQQGQTDKVWEICVEEVEKFAAKQSAKSALKTIFLVGGLSDVQLLLQIFDSKVMKMESQV